MTKRSQRLLEEIEAGALDQGTPIGDLLRKVIALGGQAGSEDMRDWATRELRGYGADDELPAYRTIQAPLQVDMANARYVLKGQTISPWELPEVAQGAITNELVLRKESIDDIDRFARQASDGVVRLSPPGAQELVVIMNSEGNVNGHVHRLYWGVSPVSLAGVVEQVRTTLIVMVAELRATMPDQAEVPPADVATNAINFAVTGQRNKINFTAGQADSPISAPPSEEHRRRWLRTVGVVLGILLAFAGAVFALMQAQGWSF